MEGLEKRPENRYTLAGSPSHLSREPLNNSIVAGPYLNQIKQTPLRCFWILSSPGLFSNAALKNASGAGLIDESLGVGDCHY
jgi:hypothetical protein